MLIGSFYLIKTNFTLSEPVSLVKVFKTILDIGMDSFGVQRVWMDTGGRWYIILSIACL
jgi:hypothetical protein